jgi:hypothetical protein
LFKKLTPKIQKYIVGLAEKVFHPPFFAFGEKRLEVLALGLRPNLQLIF